MQIYRYASHEVANYLLNHNSIRVGTLHYYKYMENTQGISDPLEGEYEDHFKPNDFTEKDFFLNQPLREQLNNFIQIGYGCRNMSFSGNTFISTKVSPNILIYCTSHNKSRKTMSQFEGADTCIEIVDQKKFFKLITKALIKKLRTNIQFQDTFTISYKKYERLRTRLDFLRPALAKTEKFIDQCELRSIWKHDEKYVLTDEFVQLTVPGLNECCRLVHPSEFPD